MLGSGRLYLIGYYTLPTTWDDYHITTTTWVLPYPFHGMTIPYSLLNLLKVTTLYSLLLTAATLATVFLVALRNLHMSTLYISLFCLALDQLALTITTAPPKPMNSQISKLPALLQPLHLSKLRERKNAACYPTFTNIPQSNSSGWWSLHAPGTIYRLVAVACSRSWCLSHNVHQRAIPSHFADCDRCHGSSAP